MSEHDIDEIDQRILYLLQEDARNNTNAEISDRVDVSPSTVGKRIKQLETTGIINGYHPDIDYTRVDFPLRILFICTTQITQRTKRIEQIRAIPGVVTVTELMTGEENIHVEVVGQENEDITDLATAIDDLGVAINEEILMKHDYRQPASVFKPGQGPIEP